MLIKSVWLAGRQGGGKSLLSIVIADECIEREIVEGAIFNMPTDLPLPDWRKNRLRKSIIGLDASHLFIDSRWSMVDDKG